MSDIKEEKAVRYRDKAGKFHPKIKEEKTDKKIWYEELPQKKQSTNL